MPVAITSAATALPRSCGANNAATTANATGIRIAAPTPITARAPITHPAVGAHAAAAEATPNTTRATTISRLRPCRSPSAPQVSINPAITNT